MRCLLADQWADSCLDYCRSPTDYRIRVSAFANLQRLSGIYFVPERSPRLLWNYLREVGPIGVWRKVASRLQERHRNEKFVSFGIGEILESPSDPRYPVGTHVAFLAPGFPACIERIVLPDVFLVRGDAGVSPTFQRECIRYLALCRETLTRADWWRRLEIWSPYSGSTPDASDAQTIATALLELHEKIDWSSARNLVIENPSAVREVVARPPSTRSRGVTPKRKRAVLFGYGHYAKTNILPNVKDHLDVESIHEVDPTQIPPDLSGARCWDTSPASRKLERFDVFLIAGFHHTHAPLAAAALKQDAAAVVEKPLAVHRQQLDTLLEAMERTQASFFGCFHKRYSPLNDYAILDFRQSPEQPIDYHCIVYEVPLPDLHWYRWPNSKSRIISNGCHWIDHFLYLNGYKEVDSIQIGSSPSGTIQCAAVLENGAYFTMTLTDKGSSRIGLQDYVELRSGDVTITIVNNSRYLSQDRRIVLRKTRLNKLATYKLMYQTIAQRIARSEGGDSLRSVRVSTQLVLDFEDALNQQ